MKEVEVFLKEANVSFDKNYSYCLPSSLLQLFPLNQSFVGFRILCPFGKSNRLVEAIVLTEKNLEEANPNLKEVAKILDVEAVLTTQQLKLLHYLCKHYDVSRSLALKLFVPRYLQYKQKQLLKLSEKAILLVEAFQKKKKRKAYALESDVSFAQAEKDFINFYLQFLKRKQISLDTLWKASFFKEKDFQQKMHFFLEEQFLSLEIEHLSSVKEEKMYALRTEESIENLLLEGKIVQEEEVSVLEALQEGALSHFECLQLPSVTEKTLKKLEKEACIYSFEKIKLASQTPVFSASLKERKERKLYKEQEDVYLSLKNLLESQKKEEALLFGVTGSGKTEVYIQLIDACLKNGKTALLLLPEISLTPMMIERFSEHFAEHMAVLHSRFTDQERLQTWKRIKEGKVSLLIGARSALFSPLEKLSLIIIDEEHETAYFSQQKPYYDSRDVARLRLQEGGLLLLGSATPSIQSMYRVREGKCQLFRLKKRAKEGKLPRIYFEEQEKEKNLSFLLSPRFLEKLQHCFDKKQKAMVLCNRRGFARHLKCTQCAQILACPRCSVALVYHQKKNRCLCHHCGYTQSFTPVCPSCHTETLSSQSYAIEAYEKALKEAFPSKKILRMDLDQMSAHQSHADLLKKFKEEYDLLLGTQMIAKGHDFPEVSFVGILGIDDLLALPHYQAAERCFQMITQASGRAGRSEQSSESEVYLETKNAKHYAVALALLQDTELFLQEEMKRRKMWALPPFVHRLLLEVEADKEEAAYLLATQLREKIAEKLKEQQKKEKKWEQVLLGDVAPAEIYKLNHKYRYTLQLSAEERKLLLSFRFYLQRLKVNSAFRLQIKMDPA